MRTTEQLIELLRTRDAVSREAAKRLEQLYRESLDHKQAVSHIGEDVVMRRDIDGMPVIVCSLFLPCYCWRHGAPGTAECDCTPPPPSQRDGYPSLLDDHGDYGC